MKPRHRIHFYSFHLQVAVLVSTIILSEVSSQINSMVPTCQDHFVFDLSNTAQLWWIITHALKGTTGKGERRLPIKNTRAVTTNVSMTTSWSSNCSENHAKYKMTMKGSQKEQFWLVPTTETLCCLLSLCFCFTRQWVKPIEYILYQNWYSFPMADTWTEWPRKNGQEMLIHVSISISLVKQLKYYLKYELKVNSKSCTETSADSLYGIKKKRVIEHVASA